MPVAYNEPITFGRSGVAKSFNCSGIDLSEDGFQSWTNAPVAEMDIQLPIARQDVLFQLDSTPFTIPTILPSQSVFVFLGGSFVGYCVLAGPAVREFLVPRPLMSGRSMRLSLVIPTARSPQSLNVSDDIRELGIHLNFILFKA